MEFMLFCLCGIQVVFIMVNVFVTIFFRLERAVVHRTITGTIITIAYLTDGVLGIISGGSFILEFVLAILWLGNTILAINSWKKVAKIMKEIEEKRKENQL